MLGNSSGSWQQRLTSSEAGSPAKQTGGSGQLRKWRCGCKPGILGPPESPLPPLLRCTVEQTATGPPTSWKLSCSRTKTNLALTWTTKPGYPTNPLALFPPALLNATASLAAEPTAWSLEHHDDMLLCSLSWSTAAVIPEPPSPAPPTLDDSGYSSPVRSPIPFDLSSAAEPDISSTTTPQKLTSDAATTTSPPSHSSTSSQTALSTAHAGTQSSLLPPNPTKDAAVTTMSPVLISSSCQSTPTACHNVSLQATVSPPSTSKKHKKRRPTQSKPSPPPPSTTDAATSYDPPPTVVPTWCHLCYSPVLPDTPPIAHLLNCDGTPELLNTEYEGLLNDWSETFDTSIDTLATMTELISTTFDPGSLSASTTAFSAKDFLISKLILRSCPTSYSTFPQFCQNLNALAASLETTCRKLLNIPPSEPLLAMFTYTNPDANENPEVDDGEPTEYEEYHPFDDLENLSDPTDDDDTLGYDEY